MKTIDEALKAFEQFKEILPEYSTATLTESDTRSKIIDYILIDVLGWKESDIKREGHIDSGYYDYRVSSPGINFLVEAKKNHVDFSLPRKHKRVSIKVLLKENSEVITQIRNYAVDEGIPYGLITNGFQYIFFKTFNTNGTPWKENDAIIFNGLEAVEKRFIEFYEGLSKLAVIENGGFKLDKTEKNLEGKSILSTVADRDKELIRNPLSGVLTPLIDKVFGEMFSEQREDDLEFIKQCFVENAETHKNKSEIERLFGDYAPNLTNIVPAVNTENIETQIISEIGQDQITIKNQYPPNPIIIIGSKGAGKTTFINHLFKYKTASGELENHFVVYIDFRKVYETKSSFEEEFLASEIIEAIYAKYENLELHLLATLIRIYIKEIKRNDENIWKWDRENDQGAYQKKLAIFLEESQKKSFSHLELLSKYLIRERRKRLIVIIDNADQFKDEIQERLFVFAQSLTRASLCGTVISLREGYYRKWQNSPPFDAYESNVYHITAPPYASILSKRMDFALEFNKSKKEDRIIIGLNGKPLTITPVYVEYFLNSIKESLLLIENSALINFVSETTYPNIREGLRVFKVFLTSGHTKVLEYIDREQQRASNTIKHYPTIPMHEFIKSIALQNKHYYNSDASIIRNLFNPVDDSNDHFIQIYMLIELSEAIEGKAHIDRFIGNNNIVEKFVDLGYRVDTVLLTLSRLIKNALLDTDEQLSDIDWKYLPATFNITLTMKGNYYLRFLLNRFHYYDLISQDTLIFDKTFYDKLFVSFPTSNSEGVRNFELRRQYALLFVEYLKDQLKNQSNQIKQLYGAFLTNFFDDATKEIDNA